MMLFKLSLKNLKKCVKDYTIYFMTLVLGVAVFYVFNSMDAQQSMIKLSTSGKQIIELLLMMLSAVSVFISFILGFLIVYANNFMIRRRKKEFGVYMTLGMGKGMISRILFGETLVIGLLSLVAGLVLGVFSSQFMSILVAKMFEADMTQYAFVFSIAAARKTVLYFGIMYGIVIFINAFAISRYKLIDLLNAAKKNERVKLKNPVISGILFFIAVGILGYAYYQVTVYANSINRSFLIFLIILGSVGTFLFFWSLAGFGLPILKRQKNLYMKDLNTFIFRQINSKINTTIFSMTIICLMLFVTICVLSCGLSLNESFRQDLRKAAPVDLYVEKTMDITDKSYSQKERKGSSLTILEALKELGFDTEKYLSETVEISSYTLPDLTFETTFGYNEAQKQKVMEQFPRIRWETAEQLIPVSEYNRVAVLQGQETYELNGDEYIVLCTFENMMQIRNGALSEGAALEIDGKSYMPKYSVCQPGYIQIGTHESNTGIILLPDSAFEKDSSLEKEMNMLSANYNADTKEGKVEIEEMITSLENEGNEKKFNLNAITKIVLYESFTGLAAIITFLAIYLGIIFMITSAAILALKELSESADNKERYLILRKIGADNKMLRRALFRQIGIFFILPLALAVIHSIFGILFANKILISFGTASLVQPILCTAAVIIAIYGGYFLATYSGSKRIIEDD